MGVNHDNSSAARAGRRTATCDRKLQSRSAGLVLLKDGRSGIERDRAGRWVLVEVAGKLIKVRASDVVG